MPRFRQIDSPANPVIKAAAKLRTRKGREQQQQIIIDGCREVTRACSAGIQLEHVFVPAGAKFDSELLGLWNAPIIELAPAAFTKVAFGNRTEVVAVAAKPQTDLQALKIGPQATVAVLEAIEKPGNIGAVMRSADAAAVDAVILVDPVTDLFNPNAIRASLGTIFARPTAVTSFEGYIAWAASLELQHFLARCDEAVDYTTVDYCNPCAIVLGSESEGLTRRWTSITNATGVQIPMLGIADSLNVSIAASVLFYEAMRQARR